MLITITKYDGTSIEVDGAPDPVGITYEAKSSIIIPGEEDHMQMIMIPWAAIDHIEYTITPSMVAPEEKIDPHTMNRAQRRATKI